MPTMVIRDIGLFLLSARSDARLQRLRREARSSAPAFDRLYTDAPHNDPWASSVAKYEYQGRKYDALVGLLPPRRYRHALDLGCGLGLFTARIAQRAEAVVGIDISAMAISLAAARLR